MAFRLALLMSTAGGAFLFQTTSAFAAQESVAPDTENPASANSVEPAPEAAAAGGDIVVTAQRRSERLQDVPISIAAFSGKQLEVSGVTNTQNLVNVTPGLVVVRASYVGQPSIRGVSTRGTGIGDEPNVATYIDGVYQPDQFGNIQELGNIERIEVLKGPQGTLFGRNATGGALNIVTVKPSLDSLEGNAAVTLGEFAYRKFSGLLSGPLVRDSVAASLSGFWIKDHGYIRNVFLNTRQGDQDRHAVRGKLLIEPTDNTEFQLIGSYAKGRESATLSGHPLLGNAQARRSANPTMIPLNILVPTGDYETATGFTPSLRVKQYAASAHGRIDFDWATLSGVASFADTKLHSFSDSDLSPLPLAFLDIQIRTRSWTQELALTSGPGRLTWILGGQLFQSRSFQDPFNSNGAKTIAGQTSRAAAGFGEATYEVVDNLFLTGGLRYSWDKKISFNQPVATGVITSAKKSWTNVAPRAVVRYEFSPDANVYASYSHGFKTGIFNPTTAAGALTPASPEKIKAFEVGTKVVVDPSLRFTLAGYHYDYTNLQTLVSITLPNGGLSNVLQNAPASKIDGFEATAVWRPTASLELNAGLSLIRAKVTDFPNASVQTPIFVGGLPAGNTSIVVNVDGNDLPRAPRSSLSVGGNYTTDLFGGELILSATAFLSARWYNDLLNRVKQPAYENLNASISWLDPSRRFKVTAFGQNLTDDRYFLTQVSSSLVDTVVFEKPRWFGATLGYTF